MALDWFLIFLFSSVRLVIYLLASALILTLNTLEFRSSIQFWHMHLFLSLLCCCCFFLWSCVSAHRLWTRHAFICRAFYQTLCFNYLMFWLWSNPIRRTLHIWCLIVNCFKVGLWLWLTRAITSCFTFLHFNVVTHIT